MTNWQFLSRKLKAEARDRAIQECDAADRELNPILYAEGSCPPSHLGDLAEGDHERDLG